MLCPACDLRVYKAIKTKSEIENPEFKKIISLKQSTWSFKQNDICVCYVCSLIRKNSSPNFCCKAKELTKVQEKVNKLTTPNKIIKKLSTKEYIQKNKKSKFEKRCSKCCSVIARGKTHKCNLTNFIDNVQGNLSQYNLKEKDKWFLIYLKLKVQ